MARPIEATPAFTGDDAEKLQVSIASMASPEARRGELQLLHGSRIIQVEGSDQVGLQGSNEVLARVGHVGGRRDEALVQELRVPWGSPAKTRA